jgi:hypothetical protein
LDSSLLHLFGGYGLDRHSFSSALSLSQFVLIPGFARAHIVPLISSSFPSGTRVILLAFLALGTGTPSSHHELQDLSLRCHSRLLRKISGVGASMSLVPFYFYLSGSGSLPSADPVAVPRIEPVPLDLNGDRRFCGSALHQVLGQQFNIAVSSFPQLYKSWNFV